MNLTRDILYVDQIEYPMSLLDAEDALITTYRSSASMDGKEMFLLRTGTREVALWLDAGQARKLIGGLDSRFGFSSDRNEEVSQ